MTDSREAYIQWLSTEIDKYCTNGYWIYNWDYRDELSPDQIIEAIDNYKEQGYIDSYSYLENKIYEEALFWSESPEHELVSLILNDLSSATEEIQKEAENSDWMLDDLQEAGFFGVDFNINDLLAQSSFDINIFFATPDEQNYDMGSIISSFGCSSRNVDIEDISNEDIDNALSYLTVQQGYRITDIYQALDADVSPSSAYISSVVDEIHNNTSEYMSELAALVHVKGEEIFTVLEQFNKKEGSIVLPEDTTVGLFNEWAGCGSLLEIQLEKPAEFPASMIRNVQFEGQTNNRGSYTVDNVYGLVNESWKEGISLKETVDATIEQSYKKELKTFIPSHNKISQSLSSLVRETRNASNNLRHDNTKHYEALSKPER
ncbi:hypothetical protein BOVMAS05_08600 [Streptococcus uberis]